MSKIRSVEVFRPGIKTDWADALVEAGETSFGKDVVLYKDGFELPILRAAELRKVITADNVEYITDAITESALDSWQHNIDVDVAEFAIRGFSPNRQRFITFLLAQNDVLDAERDALRSVVRQTAGIDIWPASSFHFDMVIGLVHTDVKVDNSVVQQSLESLVPETVSYGHAQVASYR